MTRSAPMTSRWNTRLTALLVIRSSVSFGSVSFMLLSLWLSLLEVTHVVVNANCTENRPKAAPENAVPRRETRESPLADPEARMVKVCDAADNKYDTTHAAPGRAYEIKDGMSWFVS